MKKLIIPSQAQLRIILQQDITHCMSDNCYTTLFLTNSEEYVICKSLTRLAKELDPDLFIKVNQSYLVNKSYVKLIDKKKKFVELTVGKQIPFTTSISCLVRLMQSV